MRTITLVIGICLVALSAAAEPDESWRLPLAQKEKILEENIVARHNILGLYPSQVEVPLDGSPVDTSTRGLANIAHSVCWTSNYLVGASFRYAYLKKTGAPEVEVAKALARADELFESIYRCQLVTGVRGLQSRGYVIGHGESYEEREGVDTSDEWHQGEGEYKDLRWRGSPSHHNYSASTRGICYYYDLAAQGEQKERARDAIANLVNRWVDNDLWIPHLDTTKKTPILGWGRLNRLNTRILMAIAGAKYAHHVTGEQKFKDTYDELIERFNVRGMTEFRTGKNHDDGEHCFGHLENLFRIEKDPELLAAYHIVADAMWRNHKDDAQSMFTYIYMGNTPDAPGREKALKEALYSLQTWPTDMTLQPRMSSLDPSLKAPYPMYAASWDNEYIWKGSLLRPDGWTSRIVVDVAVPKEDPMVIFAVEGGDVYQSRDGAATAAQWFPVDEGLYTANARKIDAGLRIRMVSAICDDGPYLSTNGGLVWRRLTLPEKAGTVVELRFDAEENDVIYAITDKKVYRSTGRSVRAQSRRRGGRTKMLGDEWEVFKGKLPTVKKVSVFAEDETQPAVDPRNSSIMYKAGGTKGVLKSTDRGRTWTANTKGLDIPLVQTVIVPPNTDWIFAGTPAGLFISKDAGTTWEDGHLVLQFEKNTRRELGGAAFVDAYWRGRYYGFIDDATATAPYTAAR